MPILRVLVADDHEVVRKGICAILQQQPGWQVVGEAENGREAVEKERQLKPDVSVIDIGMPVLNGMEATLQIMSNSPHAKVLVLTVHETDRLLRESLDVGARGYLLKSDAAADLVRAVEALHRGGTYFTSSVAKTLLERPGRTLVKSNNADRVASRLTLRQQEIARLLAEGKSTKEMATSLGLSVKTVETHRADILRRLGFNSVTQLVRYTLRNQA